VYPPPHPIVLRHRLVTCVTASLLALTACGDALPEWCVAPNGAALRVAQEPAAWHEAPELRPVWRVDGSERGQELQIPSSAAVSAAAGRIAIADFGLREVVVIGLNGEWLGRWGRSGEGPGELRAPYAVAWRPDGRLVVYDPAGSKLVVFDRAGMTLDDEPVDPAFTAALGGGARAIRLDGSGLLLAEPGPSFRGEGPIRTHTVLLGGVAGSGVDTVLRSEVPVVAVAGAAPMSAPGWHVPLGALHGDSLLALAGDSPEYLIRIYRHGRLTHVICRNVDPLPFSTEEVEPLEAGVPQPVSAAMARAERPSSPAPFGRLTIDDERRLWVQRDRPRTLAGLDLVIGRPGALLDVYDDDGVYLGEVRLPQNVRFLGATRNLIIGLESSELDELSVVAFQPDW
jgi:hypothetical protein